MVLRAPRAHFQEPSLSVFAVKTEGGDCGDTDVSMDTSMVHVVGRSHRSKIRSTHKSPAGSFCLYKTLTRESKHPQIPLQISNMPFVRPSSHAAHRFKPASHQNPVSDLANVFLCPTTYIMTGMRVRVPSTNHSLQNTDSPAHSTQKTSEPTRMTCGGGA